jgi:predicted AAA+ superfamily ATPase
MFLLIIKIDISIQISYILARDKAIDREFDVLEFIKDNYPKYVITMDEFDFSRNGIHPLHVYFTH